MRPVALCILALMPHQTLAETQRAEQGYLFVGAPYARTNGQVTRNSTTFRDLDIGANGARGLLTYKQEMSGFDLVYSVDCVEYVFRAHADVNKGFFKERAVSFTPYPEWAEVRFPDETVGSVGADFAAPSAQDIASERFRDYLMSGEPQEPIDVLIDGLTNLTMSRQPDRLRFMAEALIARSCFD
ncbi:MAG: hypothetical protein ABJ246_04110 [Paracoccaceae bacterium]